MGLLIRSAEMIPPDQTSPFKRREVSPTLGSPVASPISNSSTPMEATGVDLRHFKSTSEVELLIFAVTRYGPMASAENSGALTSIKTGGEAVHPRARSVDIHNVKSRALTPDMR